MDGEKAALPIIAYRAYIRGMSESSSSQNYQVLARKYRPSTFEDMIGQEALVTTLTNAFKANRVAHAFMLTGVRGIGKTTTARLLARALNYETDSVKHPSVDLGNPGIHCEAIMASAHLDVLEMDAASRTGVENMRELLDGVRYAPVSARYKVYVIDEVHMLSTGAFNALLKTLEEPPDHAKFIFATTEIRKVPITVLSRCQRFDLRRVDAAELKVHLEGICAKEGVNISSEGLSMIARAAEGSVRDSLSLLDQAIVQGGESGDAVSGEQVRTMLGLADRVRILDLFELAATGDGAGALKEMRSQYDDGADPAVVMRDLLDTCHEVSRAKMLGDEARFDAAPDQAARIKSLSETFSLGELTRMWQMLMKSHADVRMAPAPLAAAEMALLKLSLAGQMPPPELAAQIIEQMKSGSFTPPAVSQTAPAAPPTETLQAVSSSSGSPAIAAPQPNPVPQMKAATSIQLQSFQDIVDALPDSQVALKYDIEKYVRPIRFKPGSITFEPANGAPISLTGKIVQTIKDLTGELWIVSPETSGGAETLWETKKNAKAAQEAADRAHPAFEHPMLKSAKLIEIRHTGPAVQADENVLSVHFDPDENDD